MPEVTTIPIGETDFQTFNKARSEGLLEVPKPTEVPSDDDTQKEPPKKEPSDAPEKAAEPDSDSETEHDESEQGKSKGKGGFQRKIDKLTSRVYELQAENEKLKQPKLADKSAESEDTAGPPKIDDFNGPNAWEDHQRATVKWEVEQTLASLAAAQVEKEHKLAEQRLEESYFKRVSQAREEHADWDEVFGAAQPIDFPRAIGQAIKELDNGAEIAYHLAKNPEVCQQLLEMSQTRAVAEIGRISDKLMPSEVRSKEKPVSKAPPPITPVGNRSTKSSVPLDQMPFQEYKRARAEGRQT